MNEELSKALSAAQEASKDSQQLELMKAVLMGQAIAQAMQPQQQPACQHPQREPVNVGKWLGIGLAVCVGSVGLALGFLAVAIAAPCATACLLVLRSMWRDYQREK
ncbi:hypothetical protein ABT052_17865 [Streptomyces sp. NPDC002766]|uniref:hypothetical protein n=1 Tax=Streptomyces sp. NPDC002766 TaxID=3154429 RepID=UPI00331A8FD0